MPSIARTVVLVILAVSMTTVALGQPLADSASEARQFVARGDEHIQKGELDKALAAFEDAIRLDPKSAAAYERRGQVWYRKKDYNKSIKDCDEAIRLDPQYVRAFVLRGTARQQKMDLSGARKDYDQAIRLDPKNAQPYLRRGISWYQQFEYRRALKDFDQTIVLDQKNDNAFYYRARIQLSLREFDAAFADYDEAIRLNPKNDWAFAGRATLLVLCPDHSYRDATKALQDAKHACELTKWKVGNHLQVLAAAYAEAEDYSEAAKWQKKALECPLGKMDIFFAQIKLEKYEEMAAKQEKVAAPLPREKK